MRRFLLLFCFLLSLGLVAPWLADRRAPPGPVIAVRAAVSIDPLQASRFDELRLLDALFDPLVRIDPVSGRPERALASAWSVSADGLSWRFTLDPAARWSDGSLVTAAQAAAGLRRHQGGRSALSGLIGAVTTIEVAGADLVLTLAQPQPWLPAVLALPVFAPEHPANQRWHDPRRVVGNGPMVMTAHAPRDHEDLAPSPTYAGPARAVGAVRLQVIESADAAVRLYLDGQIDAITALPPDAAGDLRRHAVPGLVSSPSLGTELYRIRCVPGPAPDPAADVRVRRALALACDRTTAVTDLLGGLGDPADGLVPPSLWATVGCAPPKPITGDPQELLAAAERDLGPRATWRPFELWIPSNAVERLRVAEHLADAWARTLGVRVVVRTATAIEVRSREQRRDFDLCRGSLTADYLDPLTFLACFATGDGYNRTGWSDPAYDSLIAAIRVGGPERNALLTAAAERLAHEAPCIPLWHYRSTMLIRPGLSGLAPNPLEQVRYWAVAAGR